VQLPGKKILDIPAFLRGHSLAGGRFVTPG
jgi:hypothetical protein